MHAGELLCALIMEAAYHSYDDVKFSVSPRKF